MTPPTLHTSRLILRAQSTADFDAYAAAWADPALTRFIGGTPRDRTTSWAKFLSGSGMWPVLGHGYWSFVEAESGQWIGTGGLAKFERGVAALKGFVEAGWAFAPAAWGKGYASEAVAAVVAWGDAQGLGEIRAIIDHDNKASARVAQKCGFSVMLDPIPEFPESALWSRRA